MIAALPTAAAAVVAAAPLSTSRRFTSILLPPKTPVAHHAKQTRDRGLREGEHRDPIKNGYCQRIPQRSSAEPHPEYENETGADHRHEEPVAARRREPEDADARRFRPKDREQRQDDQHRGHKPEEHRRLPCPRHPFEHGRSPSDAAKGKALGDMVAHEPD